MSFQECIPLNDPHEAVKTLLERRKNALSGPLAQND